MDDLSAISIIEEACGYKLSKEQKTCIVNHSKKSTLINACAGSGKTSVMIFSIIFDALTNRLMPDQVLCMTFSKKAQKEMEQRYLELRARIVKMHPSIPVGYWQQPRFNTFEAFFYSRLRRLSTYSTASVCTDKTKYYQDIIRFIPNNLRNPDVTKKEDLNNIFKMYDLLISKGYSIDGISVNLKNPDVVKLLENKDKKSLSTLISAISKYNLDENFTSRYLKAVKRYQELKAMDNVIDFNDMKVKLMQALLGDHKDEIINSVKRYQEVFIDEFQDIDYLQWHIIQKLFHKIIHTNLIVVGDDDQSIYSFRGSNPYFIVNFADKLVPDAQIFNLSTNYRTDGKILKSSLPMIERNQYRLHKLIRPNNPASGLCYGDYSTKRRFQDQRFFKKLFFESRNTKKTIAVLVRYNFQKNLIADILTESHITYNVAGQIESLQESKVYQVYLRIMTAFFDNDIENYIRSAKWMGFNKFKKFLTEFRKEYYDNSNDDLENFLSSSLSMFDTKVLKEEPSSDLLLTLIEESLEILDYVKLQKKRKDHEFYLVNYFDRINELLSDGLNYYCRNHIISKPQLNVVKDHLTFKMYYYHSFLDFINDEKDRMKQFNALRHKTSNGRVQLLTIHQAKGMEFDEVFLYGETEDSIASGWITLNYDFPSNMTYKAFKAKVDSSLQTYLSLANIMVYCNMPNTGEIFDGFRSKNPTIINDTLRKCYYEIMNISANVEEERRILYVAMTRAKEMLCINFAENAPSPLLDEIDQSYVRGMSHLDAKNLI
jgi:DNA helicase-2/ATP-dependent DNA helicase PcrA